MANVKTAFETHQKTPNEKRIVNMEFFDDIEKGDTIASVVAVTVDPSGELTANAGFSGTVVQLTLESGVSGKSYHVTARATTTNGEIVEGRGKVEVEDA